MYNTQNVQFNFLIKAEVSKVLNIILLKNPGIPPLHFASVHDCIPQARTDMLGNLICNS